MAFSGSTTRQLLKLCLQHSASQLNRGLADSLIACRPLSALAFPQGLPAAWAAQRSGPFSPDGPALWHLQEPAWPLVSFLHCIGSVLLARCMQLRWFFKMQGSKRHKTDTNNLFSKPSKPDESSNVSCAVTQPCFLGNWKMQANCLTEDTALYVVLHLSA